MIIMFLILSLFILYVFIHEASYDTQRLFLFLFKINVYLIVIAVATFIIKLIWKGI